MLLSRMWGRRRGANKQAQPQVKSNISFMEALEGRVLLATGTLTSVGAMSVARTEHVAALLNDGRVLVAGGYSANPNTPLASAEIFNPATGQFTATGSMVTARRGASAIILDDGKVLVVGGWVPGSTEPTNTAEIYDPAAGTFRLTTGAMTERHADQPPLVKLNNGNVLVIAGTFESQFVSGSVRVDLYNAGTDTFSNAGSLGRARRDHAAALLPNGRVLVAGGTFDMNTPGFFNAEVFNPGTGTSAATGDMSVRRTNLPKATTLADGRVLVVGGDGGADVFNSATNTFTGLAGGTNFGVSPGASRLANGEVVVSGNGIWIFNPTSNTFSNTGQNFVRNDHAAVTLASGRVLMVGGVNASSTPLSSAQVYDPAGVPSGPPPFDFSGDGNADLLWRNYSTGENGVWFLNGTTLEGAAALPSADPSWVMSGTGDWNGDDKNDIIWRNRSTGDNGVWFMDGLTRIGAAALPAAADTNWEIGGVGDVDGDGNPDLLWRNYVTGDNGVWFMNGLTQVGAAGLPAAADTNWRMSGAADVNGDGRVDILWRNYRTGENGVWFLDGTTVIATSALESSADPNWRLVGSADFNSDGASDILWRNQSSGQNAVWLMSGLTRVGAAGLTTVDDTNWRIGWSSDVGSALGAVRPFDFNADGNPDLTWRNYSTGENGLWLMNGASLQSAGALPASTDTHWRMAGSGDFDRDGRLDILWRNRITGENGVWFMDGLTQLGAAGLPAAVDTNWRIGGVGDLNGDGSVDLFWRNQSTGDNGVWYLDGTSLLSAAPLPAAADTNWRMAGAGDSDRDGKTDTLLWRNYSTGENGIWFLDGTTVTSAAGLETSADTNWRILGLADFDGDQKLDILWRNQSSGDNAVWLLDGISRVGVMLLPAAVDSNWYIGWLQP